MAWYAELKRRHWYCINQWNAISWYRKYLYDTWYNALTPEQKDALKEHERLEKERRQKELQTSLMKLGAIASAMAGLSTQNYDKYNGLYDANGNVNQDFFRGDKDESK